MKKPVNKRRFQSDDKDRTAQEIEHLIEETMGLIQAVAELFDPNFEADMKSVLSAMEVTSPEFIAAMKAHEQLNPRTVMAELLRRAQPLCQGQSVFTIAYVTLAIIGAGNAPLVPENIAEAEAQILPFHRKDVLQ